MTTKLAAVAKVSSTFSSKYGHFWLQKSKMVMVKSLINSVQTAVHKNQWVMSWWLRPQSITFFKGLSRHTLISQTWDRHHWPVNQCKGGAAVFLGKKHNNISQIMSMSHFYIQAWIKVNIVITTLTSVKRVSKSHIVGLWNNCIVKKILLHTLGCHSIFCQQAKD